VPERLFDEFKGREPAVLLCVPDAEELVHEWAR
jgi:hypothetical protein